MGQRDKEKYQYITFDSMKRNFHSIFGFNHDKMAELLFRYLSDCRVDARKITYL